MTAQQHLGILLLSLVVALALAATFTASVRGRGIRRIGAWPIFVIFFLPVLLGSWAGALWLVPAGPVLWGVYWVPILCVGLATALILASFIPRGTRSSVDPPHPAPPRAAQPENIENTSDRHVAFEVGTIFWVALIFFILLLLGGFFRA